MEDPPWVFETFPVLILGLPSILSPVVRFGNIKFSLSNDRKYNSVNFQVLFKYKKYYYFKKNIFKISYFLLNKRSPTYVKHSISFFIIHTRGRKWAKQKESLHGVATVHRNVTTLDLHRAWYVRLSLETANFGRKTFLLWMVQVVTANTFDK